MQSSPEPKKRTLDFEESNNKRQAFKSNSKTVIKPTTITMRLLISSQHSGILIGKSGATINEIRDQSGARVNISPKMLGAPDRIFTAVGSPETCSEAFALVATKLAQEEQSNINSIDIDWTQRALTLRFLIPNELMGSIIGKKASKIKEIQTMTNARISAMEGLLPNSTERKLNIIGNVESIKSSILMIAKIMASYPERSADNVPYRPRPFLEAMPAIPVMTMPFPTYDSFLHSHSHPPPSSTNSVVLPHSSHTTVLHAPPFASLSYPNPLHIPSMMNPSFPLDNPSVFTCLPSQSIQEINIPKKFVGYVIGKGGKYISEIREKSGCDVQLNDSKTEESSDDRIISIAGPNDGVQIALQMIFNKIMEK